MTRRTSQIRRALELLESRLVPTAEIQGEFLHIEGTAVRDSVTVLDMDLPNSGPTLVVYERILSLPVKVTKIPRPEGLVGVFFAGYGGNDSFWYSNLSDSAPLGVVAWGGTGNDDLHGEDGTDFLFGEQGNDVLSGGDRDDQLFGGGGADRLWGGKGNDKLYGGDGPISNGPTGPDGLDILYGEDGNDFLSGGDDGKADMLVGGRGRDTFVAETGFHLRNVKGVSMMVKFNRDQPRDFRPLLEGDTLVDSSGKPWTE